MGDSGSYYAGEGLQNSTAASDRGGFNYGDFSDGAGGYDLPF